MRKNQRQRRGPTLEGTQSAGANATPRREVQDDVVANGGAPTIALLDVTGSLVLGVALAVSQPVLDLLSRNLTFFTAHQATPLDVVGLALLLTVALPLAVALPVAWSIRVAPRSGLIVYGTVLGLLGAAVAVPFLERVVDSSVLVAVLAATFGGLVVVACLRVESLQTLLRWGGLVPAAILAVFMVISPGSQVVFASEQSSPESTPIGNPVPVILLVLDELPVQSLMDREGDIDDTRYPGFARLLDDFTWFRNAATMHQNTGEVLPVILSGGRYKHDVGATAAGYPENLFSLVGSSYDVWAHEGVTSLCTPELCRDQRRPTALERWPLLISDTSIVTAHVLLPDAATTWLPTLEGTWTGFASRQEDVTAGKDAEQGASFDDLLYEIRTGSARSSLRFFHLLDPHHPWNALPEGLRYHGDAGIPSEGSRWGEDQHVVDKAHQRHLLQTGFVDRQIGQFVDTLRDTAWYDDALVIVTADHGMAFTAGGYFRGGKHENIEEIAYVPLFVKAPGQTAGRVDNRPASLYDIIPTIVDSLDIETTWSFEGVSLLEEAFDPERQRLFEGLDTIKLPAQRPSVDDVVAAKTTLFGARQGWEPVYNFGPHRELVGLAVSELGAEADEAEVALTRSELYEDVNPDTGRVPALIRASIRSSTLTPDTWLAVGVNGTVAATGRVHEWNPQGARFSAIVPPTSFVEGPNSVSLYRIDDSGLKPTLHALSEVDEE